MTLKETLRQGKVKVGDYIDYKPTFGRCVLTQEQTGWEKDQLFETEDLGWRLDKIDGSLLLIASKPTKELYLKGTMGSKKGLGAMRTLCQGCYSNPQFSQKVVPIKQELACVMSKCHIISESYWLGTASAGSGYGAVYKCLGPPSVYIGIVLSNGHFDYWDGIGISTRGVRPVVYLKSDLQLNGGSGTQDDPWKILLPKGKELLRLSIEEVEKRLSEITEMLKNNAIQEVDFIKAQEELLQKLRELS